MVRKIKTDEELLAMMPPKSEKNDEELDLGIADHTRQPSLGNRLYAQRIVAGHAEMPETVDSELQTAIAIETGKQSNQLVEPPEASQQQLEVCLREFGFQALTAQEFIQAGVEYINQATIYACRAGVAFWAAQEAVKSDSAQADSGEKESTTPGRSRDFKEWIEKEGLSEQRVYECIRIAKFYSRLPEESRAKALTISKKHALLLASLPQEIIDQAAHSGNDLIDKADMMTVAQLKDEIKSLRRREKNYEAELERAQHQVKRLSEAKTRTTDFLLRTEEIREECMALQLGAELHINSLHKLFDEIRAEDPSLPEWRLQIEQVWVVAHVVAARALDMVERMKERVRDGEMPERVMGQHILTPGEAERWLLDYPMIENRHAAEAATRQDKRDAAKPRGPGRPKGSSNKGAEE